MVGRKRTIGYGNDTRVQACKRNDRKEEPV